MRVRDDEDEESVEVNLAPLIDCIFLLLIFFLLTSTIQKADDDRKQQQLLALELPESAAAVEAPAQAKPLVISVDEAGRFYVDQQRVGVEALHRAVREAAAGKSRVRIEGDRRAPFDHVARVIDLCAFEGLHDVAVRTRDK